MIRAVLLDIDNTLLDFDAYVQTAMKEGFEQFGLGEYTEKTYEIFLSINGPLWHALEKKEITYQELLQVRWNKVFAALGITFDGLAFEKYFNTARNKFIIPPKQRGIRTAYLLRPNDIRTDACCIHYPVAVYLIIDRFQKYVNRVQGYFIGAFFEIRGLMLSHQEK